MGGNCNVLIAVLLAWARVLPATMGAKKCRKEGVGAVLEELRREDSELVIGPFAEVKREAAHILEANCRVCGLCKLGRPALMP